MASCWRDRRAALHHAAGARVGQQRAERAGDVDAEMLVEAAVFGRQRRLDQVIGKIFERDRVVVLDAAGADRIAVAVEERHREIGFLQPVFVGGFAKRREWPAPASAIRPSRPKVAASDSGSMNTQRFQRPTWKRSMNVEKRSYSSRSADARREQRRIDARVEVQQEMPEPASSTRLGTNWRTGNLDQMSRRRQVAG